MALLITLYKQIFNFMLVFLSETIRGHNLNYMVLNFHVSEYIFW